MRFKISGKWRPFCLGLNELNYHNGTDIFIITYTLISTLCCFHYRIFQQSAHCAGLYTQLGFPTAQTLDIAIIQAELWYGLNSFGMAMFQVSRIRIENIFRTCTRYDDPVSLNMMTFCIFSRLFSLKSGTLSWSIRSANPLIQSSLKRSLHISQDEWQPKCYELFTRSSNPHHQKSLLFSKYVHIKVKRLQTAVARNYCIVIKNTSIVHRILIRHILINDIYHSTHTIEND